MKKPFLVCVFLLLSLQSFLAQNFIADSSFEYNSAIPTLLSSIGMNGSWSTPTRATTDLFCTCHKKLEEISECNVPTNSMGTQKANSGKCYAGIYAFSHHDYREYLLTQLTSPLSGGVKYELSFYISLADWSRATVDQIGVCFLKGKVTYTNTGVITGFKPVYAKLSEEVGNDTVSWHQITIEYKAKGGEQYLLLGSFEVNELQPTYVKAPKHVHTRLNQRTDVDAYYYIDDVCLREVAPVYVAKWDTIVKPKVDTLNVSVAVELAKPQYEVLEEPIILKNVLFETNAAVLLPSSYGELDLTAEHLKKNNTLKIQVNGYTDNTGDETKNVSLSERRAKAVAEYLITKEIDASRITFKGHGSKNPIAFNNTEEGRKQNRRVELVFSK
jgi:outer membrane protein OmpA-like peptidoglycan-associated protein